MNENVCVAVSFPAATFIIIFSMFILDTRQPGVQGKMCCEPRHAGVRQERVVT